MARIKRIKYPITQSGVPIADFLLRHSHCQYLVDLLQQVLVQLIVSSIQLPPSVVIILH